MENLRQMFGDEFLAYCLNTAAASVPEALTSVPDEVAGDMTFVSALTQSYIDQQSYAEPGLGQVVAYRPDAGTSTANVWRRACGGDVPDIEAEDDVARSLLILARDVYPALLLKDHPNKFQVRGEPRFGYAELHKHPAFGAFVDAVLRDDRLSVLFPGKPQDGRIIGEGIASVVYWTSGSGGGLFLGGLAALLLNAATMRLPHAPQLADYLREVGAVLEVARRLGAEDGTEVPVIVGLANLTVESDEPITFEGGVLRRPGPWDERSLSNTRNITAILEVQVPVKVFHLVPAEDSGDIAATPPKWLEGLGEFEAGLRRRIHQARLALLLASPDDVFLAPSEVVVEVCNPLMSSSRGISPMAYHIPPFGATALTSEDIPRLRGWAAKTASHPQHLDVTMRRLLAAASSRIDPVDGFVDAVICWENMFGAEQETTFRVCGSLAALLVADPDPVNPDNRLAPEAGPRTARLIDLKKLYNRRSRLVHGASEGDPAATRVDWERAVRISIEALRALYDRPELLAIESAELRGSFAVLGCYPTNPKRENRGRR